MSHTRTCLKCRSLIGYHKHWIWLWPKLYIGSGLWYKNGLDERVLEGRCTGCIRVYAHKVQVGLLTLLNRLDCCSSLMEKGIDDKDRIVDRDRIMVDELSPLFIFSLNTLGDKLIVKNCKGIILDKDSRGENNE